MSNKLKNPDFLRLFCEKNSDGTFHLRLKGRELYLRIGCRVNKEHMEAIALFMKEDGRIVSLDLSYNDIGDEGMATLANIYFSEPNRLIYLNIMHCDITANGMKSLSGCPHLNLITCKLNGNKLGPNGARYIGDLIDRCLSLKVLNIAETDQILESIESILIITEYKSLTVLDISRILPNSYYMKLNPSTLADDLISVLKINTTLKELHVQKCEFDGHDVELLTSGLYANKTLEMLNIGCNRIGDMGAEIISTWLKTRPVLKGLDISCNDIRSLGAKALGLGLPYSRLRLLDISDNKMCDRGVKNILDTLKKSCQIRMLYMWGNDIKEKSCDRLEQLLKAGVLKQECIDVKLYTVDSQLTAAYYPSNLYKLHYYHLMGYGYPPELKIIRHKIPGPMAQPRELTNFTDRGRYPEVDESLGLKVKKEKVCPEDTLPDV